MLFSPWNAIACRHLKRVGQALFLHNGMKLSDAQTPVLVRQLSHHLHLKSWSEDQSGIPPNHVLVDVTLRDLIDEERTDEPYGSKIRLGRTPSVIRSRPLVAEFANSRVNWGWRACGH